jgi:hypothetical protein
MPYIKRNQKGAIIAVTVESSDGAVEWLDATDHELAAFLNTLAPTDDFSRSDQDLIRVIEDIVNTLIDKNLIRFTDLPGAAQQKLMTRRSQRQARGALDLRVGEQALQPEIKL